MNIGIVGNGIVGSAVKYGFEKLGHNIVVHDIKLTRRQAAQQLPDDQWIFNIIWMVWLQLALAYRWKNFVLHRVKVKVVVRVMNYAHLLDRHPMYERLQHVVVLVGA